MLHGGRTWRTKTEGEGKTAVKSWQKTRACPSISPLTNYHYSEVIFTFIFHLSWSCLPLSFSSSNVKCFFSSDPEPVAESSLQGAKAAAPAVKTHDTLTA